MINEAYTTVSVSVTASATTIEMTQHIVWEYSMAMLLNRIDCGEKMNEKCNNPQCIHWAFFIY